ncbi:MAG: (Fe-S)-binding protein [Bilophila sp.]
MGEGTELVHLDVMQFVQERLQGNPELFKGKVLYHASCHPEWVGVHKVKGIKKQSVAIAKLSGAVVEVSPGCCGESGMGAIASPLVYNTLRKRKMDLLAEALEDYPAQTPVLVGCPSCKVGIARSLMGLHSRRPVLHTVEWIATLLFREKWGRNGFAFSGGGLRPVRTRRACAPSISTSSPPFGERPPCPRDGPLYADLKQGVPYTCQPRSCTRNR